MKYWLLFYCLLYSFSVHSSSKAEILFKGKTKIKSPLDLRDPFKTPEISTFGSQREKKGFKVIGKNFYTNVTEMRLDTLSISNLKIVGVLIGKERRAILQMPNGVITLREGMKIGPENAELKAIFPGGIVLVEKIVNVYGEEEYLETVVPISK